MNQNQIIEHLAKKHNLDKRVIETVVYHQFHFTKREIEKGPGEIRLLHLGKFVNMPHLTTECCGGGFAAYTKEGKVCKQCGKICKTLNEK